MKRRDFIALLGGSVSAWPSLARAQSPSRVYRLGHLGNTLPTEALTRETTLPELARLGFVEGRNLIFDARVGEPDTLPGLMRELVAARPDAVIAIGAAAIVAAHGFSVASRDTSAFHAAGLTVIDPWSVTC